MKNEEAEQIKDVITMALLSYYLQDNHEPTAKFSIMRSILNRLYKEYACEKAKPLLLNLIADVNMLVKIDKVQALLL
jgi:hypothetical protein